MVSKYLAIDFKILITLFNFLMKYKIVQRMSKSIELLMALKVGRRKAAAMLSMFTVRLSNEKSAKAPL